MATSFGTSFLPLTFPRGGIALSAQMQQAGWFHAVRGSLYSTLASSSRLVTFSSFLTTLTTLLAFVQVLSFPVELVARGLSFSEDESLEAARKTASVFGAARLDAEVTGMSVALESAALAWVATYVAVLIFTSW